MGKFANAPETGMSMAYVGDTPPPLREDWHGQSGFDAMGFKVPAFRKAAAEEHMKDMGFTSAEQRFDVISTMSNCIERDNSHMALEKALSMGVDATGCYRLLAVLLTAEPAVASEPSYLDLVGASS